MATIRIQRTSEFTNKMRDYKIFIDGQESGTIANGETKDFAVTSGQHFVTAKIDWCSSPDVSIVVKENEVKNLEVGGFNPASALLSMVYYLTIGRKKYLSLNEI